MISNDKDLGFFLNDIFIFIFIYHRTPLCVSTIEKMIPYVPNLTQDSHIPSFVLEIAECEKNPDNEVVLSVPALSAPLVPVNDDHMVECPYSPYNE